MKRPNKVVTAGLALTAAAALTAGVELWPSSKKHVAAPVGAVALTPPTEPGSSLEAAPSRSPMTPDQARLAITGGLACKLGNVGRPFRWHNDTAGLTFDGMNVNVLSGQSGDSLAAQQQYDTSDAVLWRFFVGGEVYSRQQGRYKDEGVSMIADGARPGRNPNQVDMPIAATRAGDTLLVYAGVDVRTGSPGHGTRLATVAKVPCGALHQVDGHWVPDPDLHVPGSLADYDPAVLDRQHAPYAFNNEGLMFPRPGE
jgi:hypothetical protein